MKRKRLNKIFVKSPDNYIGELPSTSKFSNFRNFSKKTRLSILKGFSERSEEEFGDYVEEVETLVKDNKKYLKVIDKYLGKFSDDLSIAEAASKLKKKDPSKAEELSYELDKLFSNLRKSFSVDLQLLAKIDKGLYKLNKLSEQKGDWQENIPESDWDKLDKRLEVFQPEYVNIVKDSLDRYEPSQSNYLKSRIEEIEMNSGTEPQFILEIIEMITMFIKSDGKRF